MIIIKPDSDNLPQSGKEIKSIFLAGSIEQGKAIDWQKATEEFLSKVEPRLNCELIVFNPRRDNWNADLSQTPTNLEFNYQVNWEMNKLKMADVIFLHLEPGCLSPVSLIELGHFSSHPGLIVSCPSGFWRKGNVEIFTTRLRIPLYDSLQSAWGGLLTMLQQ
jgi:hypothetical protein